MTPEDAGLPRGYPAALRGGDAAGNAAALRSVLEGRPGPLRDIVLLNAAAALVVAGKVADLREGVAAGARAVDEGGALAVLDRLVAVTNEAARDG